MDDPRFARGITNRSVFKFLPGHRKRIIDFVQQIKFNLNQEEKLKRSKKKMKLCAPATKVKKAKYEDEEPDDVVDQAKAVVMIRQQITKWQRTQSSSKLRELKENVHYEIKVTLSKDSSNLTPSLLCKGCDKSTLLGFKGGNVLLSNWTRHIIMCVEKPKTPASKESKIQDFFSHKVIPNKSMNLSRLLKHPKHYMINCQVQVYPVNLSLLLKPYLKHLKIYKLKIQGTLMGRFFGRPLLLTVRCRDRRG